ncbi:hypothetical protein MKI84_01420 [Ancylobacter sp. A5.8]|nr:hypothetical protein [Ancylobacter gelatini]MCJ8141569.1 hypothetical protein [Ancylobacter gelatini]
MWFLALELWPYLIGALAIGVITGWLGGCAPSMRPGVGDDADRKGAR